ncbi:hypothetical protein E2C01_072039 [Portunus trituberculatus]|uniref:Uncharacterized protein n=1 Tax=Portunus trituberculatus TaxID=210409 RepID=A0A5B7HWY4_PORTR|nr:hypothetical protein [Portunus trituberculatus]
MVEDEEAIRKVKRKKGAGMVGRLPLPFPFHLTSTEARTSTAPSRSPLAPQPRQECTGDGHRGLLRLLQRR